MDRTHAHDMLESSDGSSPILGFKGRSWIRTMSITNPANDGIPLVQRSDEHVRSDQAQTVECHALPLAGVPMTLQ